MSDAIAQTLTIPAVNPPGPYTLCSPGFLTTLAQVEREVAHASITDADSAQAAANILSRLTTAGTVLEKARKEVKQPFLDKCAEIDAAARAPANRIEAAKAGIKAKVTAYAQEQARLAAEREAARQKELQRLEAIRREEERIAKEKADALAKAAAEAQAKSKMVLEIPDFDDGPVEPPKTETEKAIEAVRFAPVVAEVKPVGVAFRVTLLIDSIDVAKLPEMFVVRTANEKALRETFCRGFKEGDPVPECGGVKFRVVKEPVSTGRAVF